MTATSASPCYHDVVGLERYPIHDPGSPEWNALVARVRRELERHGCCSLPGFLQPEAIERMVELSAQLKPRPWASDQTHNVYFEPIDDSLPAEHPMAHRQRSAKQGIAYDHIPQDAHCAGYMSRMI